MQPIRYQLMHVILGRYMACLVVMVLIMANVVVQQDADLSWQLLCE